MLLRLRLARVCLLACALIAHPSAAALAATSSSATVQTGDASVTAVDSADTGAASDTAATSTGPSTNFGIAAAACRSGMTIASGNVWQLGGVGLMVCMVGIYFELEDFMN